MSLEKRMRIDFAKSLKREIDGFADVIFPDQEYAELIHAGEALEKWIKKQEEQLKEVKSK
jgi:hypothetical protein